MGAWATGSGITGSATGAGGAMGSSVDVGSPPVVTSLTSSSMSTWAAACSRRVTNDSAAPSAGSAGIAASGPGIAASGPGIATSGAYGASCEASCAAGVRGGATASSGAGAGSAGNSIGDGSAATGGGVASNRSSSVKSSHPLTGSSSS